MGAARTAVMNQNREAMFWFSPNNKKTNSGAGIYGDSRGGSGAHGKGGVSGQ